MWFMLGPIKINRYLDKGSSERPIKETSRGMRLKPFERITGNVNPTM